MNTPATVQYRKPNNETVYGLVTKITKSRIYMVLASDPAGLKKISIDELRHIKEIDNPGGARKAKATIKKYARTMGVKLPKSVKEALAL